MRWFKLKSQPKEEHPLQEEWNAIRSYAKVQGLLHNDGSFAVPPQGGSAFSPAGVGQSHKALLVLMQTTEISIIPPQKGNATLPAPRIDPKLIGEEYR